MYTTPTVGILPEMVLTMRSINTESCELVMECENRSATRIVPFGTVLGLLAILDEVVPREHYLGPRVSDR